MSGVVIWCEHECPGWSFDVSTNVRPCQKSRGNECPWERMSGIHIIQMLSATEAMRLLLGICWTSSTQISKPLKHALCRRFIQNNLSVLVSLSHLGHCCIGDGYLRVRTTSARGSSTVGPRADNRVRCSGDNRGSNTADRGQMTTGWTLQAALLFWWSFVDSS